MPMRLQLWMLFLAPIALLGGMYAFGLSIPVPHFGRDYVIRLRLPDPDARIGLPKIYGPEDAGRPLVVIDAGHGGHDPGAGGEGYREKDIVLALALALKDRLLEQGGVRVALTREDDRFLVLQERSEIARRLGADLFLSVHADSAGEQEGVGGATIYMLSQKASDEATARLAARENDADHVNGIALGEQSDVVSAILVDLSQRHANEAAGQLANLIIREGEGQLAFHESPRRSAAFAVLKAPDVPSLLFEAGYITNPVEAQRLASTKGRATFAEVMARAIRIYFARQDGA
jgi:N-acetylmuramoyl-L-alanine amidase